MSKQHQLVIHMRSAGIKNGPLPKADFLVDCRGQIEKGRPNGGGANIDFQTWFAEKNASRLVPVLEMVIDAIDAIPSRRDDHKDPYDEPFIILFFCAHGMHRSVATKHIIAKKLAAYYSDALIEVG